MAYLEYQFRVWTPKSVYSNCRKVWGHRGYFKGGLVQNSIESISKAFDLGAAGVEIDVFYDEQTSRFVVSHDFPYNLKNGQLLTLKEVFEKTGNRGYFWLDFKNLGSLPPNVAETAAANLQHLLSELDLVDKAFVESKHLDNLTLVAQEGLYTSFWFPGHNIRTDHYFSFLISLCRVKSMLRCGEISAISMDYRQYAEVLHGTETRDLFPQMPIYLFTVNDRQTLSHLIEMENVKIVLSDEDYYLDVVPACTSGVSH